MGLIIVFLYCRSYSSMHVQRLIYDKIIYAVNFFLIVKTISMRMTWKEKEYVLCDIFLIKEYVNIFLFLFKKRWTIKVRK